MTLNAQAAQAKSLPAGVIQRFISISNAYLGRPRGQNLVACERSEFVDPPRYRSTARFSPRRACS